MIGLLSRFNTSGGSIESSREIYLVTLTATKNGSNITNNFAFLNDSPIDTFSDIVNLCNMRNDYGTATLAGVGMHGPVTSSTDYYLTTHCGTSDSSLVFKQIIGAGKPVISESEYTISIENIKFTPSGRFYQNNGKIISGDAIIGWITVWSSEPIRDYFGLLGTVCLQNDNGSLSHFAHGYVRTNSYTGKISDIMYSNDNLVIGGMIDSANGYRRYQSLLTLDSSSYECLAEWNSIRLA